MKQVYIKEKHCQPIESEAIQGRSVSLLKEETMRYKKLFPCVLAFLFLLSSFAFALDYIYPAKVERVIDGDTIVVDLSFGLNVILDDQYIRLYGINAWELKKEQREKGLEAKEYLEKRLSKGKVEIEIRPEGGKEKYGRWLGIVYVDGVNINAELIEKGYAEETSE